MVETLAVVVGKATDTGRKKPKNEDWVALYAPESAAELEQSGRLYIVADGVGGAARGERASQYAAKKVLYDFYHSSDPDLGERLRHAIIEANADIYQHTERSESQAQMGTTLVAAALRGRQLEVANVGDSRAYLIRGEQVVQISHDHSLVQKLLDEKELTPEEARTFRRKNVILRSVGADEYVEVDLFHHEVLPGDALLLCTDGLHKYFEDPRELAHLALDGPPQPAADRLIAEANARGGSDNISVIIARLYDPQLPPPWVTAAAAATLPGRPPETDDMPTRHPASQNKQAWANLTRQSKVMVVILGALIVIALGLGLAIATQVLGTDAKGTATPKVTFTSTALTPTLAAGAAHTPKPTATPEIEPTATVSPTEAITATSSTTDTTKIVAPTALPIITPGPAIIPTLAITPTDGLTTTSPITASVAPTGTLSALETLLAAPKCSWVVKEGDGIGLVFWASTWPPEMYADFVTVFLSLNGEKASNNRPRRQPGSNDLLLVIDEKLTVPWNAPLPLPANGAKLSACPRKPAEGAPSPSP